MDNQLKPELYCIIYPQPRRAPLLAFERAYQEAKRKDALELLFDIFIELLKLCTGSNLAENKYLPMCPELRVEVRKSDTYIQDRPFLFDCNIGTEEELSTFKANAAELAKLEAQRQHIRNRIRRAADPTPLKEQAKEITSQITPFANAACPGRPHPGSLCTDVAVVDPRTQFRNQRTDEKEDIRTMSNETYTSLLWVKIWVIN